MNDVVISPTSGVSFESGIAAVLDRTLNDVDHDISLPGYRSTNGDAILPDIAVMDDYLNSSEMSHLGDTTIFDRLYLQMKVYYADPEAFSDFSCPERSIGAHMWTRLTPADVLYITENPPAHGLSTTTKTTKTTCEKHWEIDDYAFEFPALTLARYTVAPLRTYNFLDLSADMHTALYDAYLRRCTIRELVNAHGIDIGTDKSAGYRTNIRMDTDHFEIAHSAISEFAAQGDALSWLMLAGWNTKRSTDLLSRIPVVRGLAEKMDVTDALAYLRGGAKNLRDVEVLAKARIDSQEASGFYGAGISNIATIKRMHSSGIDTNLADGIMTGIGG